MNCLRTAICSVSAGLSALVIAVAPAQAHPLGNFTINHLVKVGVHGSTLDVRYVLDMAEIPTFEIMRSRSADGRMDATALRAWAKAEVAPIAAQLDVESRGARLPLHGDAPRVSTRPGAGGLPTLYWVEDYRAALPAGARDASVTDGTFPGRIGWKDVVLEPASEPTDELRHYPTALLTSPRAVNAVAIAIDARGAHATSHVAQATAGGAGAPQASQVRSNLLSDLLARGTSSPLLVILTLLAAVGLGALHAAEPGHGKTLLAVSLVGARATVRQAALLAAGLTAAHTAGVLALGVVMLVAARWIVPEAIYPWLTLVSGMAVIALGAGALARAIRAWRGRAHGHAHDHDHAHDGSHEHGHTHPHPAAYGAPDAPLSFRNVMLVAMSGNIAPCPAALVVLLAALALHQVAYGLAVIVAFSAGLAGVLTALGIALVRGAAWLSRQPAFDTIARHAPLLSAAVISTIGAVMIGQAAAAGAIQAPPVTASLLAGVAVVAYALAPGHSHARQGAAS